MTPPGQATGNSRPASGGQSDHLQVNLSEDKPDSTVLSTDPHGPGGH